MDHSPILTKQLEAGIFSVLVVDDDPDIVSGMKDILEDSGYTVVTAAGAAEARERLREKTFSVMVSDYSLPDDNGIQLSRDAKKLQPSLGLILMTGHDPRHTREKLHPGEMEFMRKPVEVSVLLGAMERAMHHSSGTLKIRRKIPVVPRVEPIPLPKPASGPVAQVDYPTAKRKGAAPLASALMVLIGFGIGWVSRTAIPLPPENTPVQSMVQPERQISSLPAGDATLRDATIAPPVQVPPPHRSRLADEDPAVRISAAKSLLRSNSHHAKALKALLAILADPLSKKHLAAIEALSTTGASDPQVVSSLARALSDDNPSVACAAATTLGRLGHSALPAVEDLVQALIYKEGLVPSVALAAHEALIGLGELAVPALNKGLNDLKIRPQALEVLARIAPHSPGPTTTFLPQDQPPSTDQDAGLDDVPDTGAEHAAAPAANDHSTIH